MIKRLLAGIKPRKERRYSAAKLGIKVEDISPFAVEVVDCLVDNGHEAYIVGGCIRDILLGRQPKDFDVATSATPEQVKPLFRRSRIVGRRFKIVHVQDRREIIEVTTFRGDHRKADNRTARQSGDGVLLRDNHFGSLEEDARRRDFGCNSLYFDLDNEEIIDFCDGVTDLKKGTLRTIGDPASRFQEDPVRMLRAIRFQAKLGLSLDKQSARQLTEQRNMIKEVSSARMFDELIKLLMHEASPQALQQLQACGLFQKIFPETHAIAADSPKHQRLLEIGMENTARRLKKNQRVSPFFLYATLLWPQVEKHYLFEVTNGLSSAKAMDIAGSKAILSRSDTVVIPKRFALPIRDTWYLQTQLDRRGGNRAERLMQHPRFRAGYDFLLMREAAGEDLSGLGDWWTRYQDSSTSDRENMVNAISKTGRQKRNRSHRRPRKTGPK